MLIFGRVLLTPAHNAIWAEQESVLGSCLGPGQLVASPHEQRYDAGVIWSWVVKVSQGLLFWLFTGGFKVSSGTVEWYRSSYDTDFGNSEIAGCVSGFDVSRSPHSFNQY